MTAPSWLTGTFAVMMLAVAGYCVVRLGMAWRWRRATELDTDGVHTVMGVAMAGMLMAGLRTLPAGVWAAVFGMSAGWFGWQAVRARRGVQAGPWRCSHPLPHVVESLAMLYMLLAMHRSLIAGAAAAMESGRAMPAAGDHLSVLALALAVYSVGYVVWLGDRLTGPPGAAAISLGLAGGAGLGSLAPRSSACCKIAMGVTMGYMLILMV
ncbi:MAG TPA: DUF5134 domain-containing protein [Streptosporangiaceae bacterium]